MYVVNPVIGNSDKEDLTYNQHYVYNHHQRSVSELTNMNKTFLSGNKSRIKDARDSELDSNPLAKRI